MSDQISTRSSTAIPIPRFSGESYQILVVKMRSYLKSFGLWEFVDQDKQIPPLRANPTIAQIKQHEEEKMKKEKAVACLHSALTDAVFTSIMHLETAKEIWDELKGRYEGTNGSNLVKKIKRSRALTREMLIKRGKERWMEPQQILQQKASFLLAQLVKGQTICQRIVGTKASLKFSVIIARNGDIEKSFADTSKTNLINSLYSRPTTLMINLM
ncbi:hypothetical protein LWI29_020521 [Acer saccharum]|uniref:Uncharacterized protein n=1 Tax=Acer saccharum TaxID=4024 RepID=A0AA39RZC9_ACESA|nr:hypothetical protein LWI29_020521 [Acer saccharum]